MTSGIWLRILLAGACLMAPAGQPAPACPSTSASPHPPGLVSTDQLAEWQKSCRLSIVDVRSDLFAYLKGHLPGAGYLNPETLRASENGIPAQLLGAEMYRQLFSRLGLSMDVPVVIYSAGETRNIDATFLAWLLAGFGHPGVYVLNGGYFKWELEQRRIVQEYSGDSTAGFSSPTFTPERASLQDVRRTIRQHDALLVDARPPDQYAGEAGAQIRRGHIPGAINHYWQDDLKQEGFGYVWKDSAELRAGYAAQGITPDRNIILYCNSTTEASHVHFTLRNLLGYPRVRIYVGSWTEWAARFDLPVEAVKRGSGAAGQ